MKKKKSDIESLLRIISVAVLAVLLISFFLYPLTELLKSAFSENGTFTLTHFERILESKFGRTAVMNSFIIAILTVITSGAVGIFLAFFTEYYKVLPGIPERILKIVFLIPFMIPGVIIVLSSLQIFGSLGVLPQLLKNLLGLKKVPFALKGIGGVIFIHAITQYIYFYINTSIGLKNLDRGRTEAAMTLGASKRAVLRDIILPHLKPYLLSSALLTFLSGIGSFSAPYLLEGSLKTITTEVMQYKSTGRMGEASALVTIMFIFCTAVIIILTASSSGSMEKMRGVQKRGKREELKGMKKTVSAFLLIFLSVLILLPVAAVIYFSFIHTSSWMMDIFPRRFTLDNYLKTLSESRLIDPLKTSLYLSIAASVTAVIIASAGAMVSLKNRKDFTAFFFTLPMVLPASTLGIALITAYNRPTPFTFNRIIMGTPFILILGYILLSLTTVFSTVRNEFSSFRTELWESSNLLGAGEGRTMRRVFLPEVMPGLFYAFSLIFLRSMGEYTVSVLTYSPGIKPVSIAMVAALQDYDIGISMVYGTILILFSFLFILILRRVTGTFEPR